MDNNIFFEHHSFIIIMDENKIVLEWIGYNPTKESALQALYEDQDFADVTLVSENSTSIQVHKVVLSLCSDFFRKTLKQNPNPHPLIFLQGVSQEDLQVLKKFMYMGRTEIRTEQIESFMNVSKRFLNHPPEKEQTISAKTLLAKENNSEVTQKSATLCQEKRENPEEKENPKRSPSIISTTVLEELSNVLESTEQISCPLCDFKCTSTKVLKRHNYKKHLDQNIPCTEDECGKILKNRWTLQGHIKSKHIGRTNQFMCDKCDYSCKWVSSFQEHTMKHTGNFIQCSQCEYRCTTNQALKKHMESKHNVAEYACDKCETKTRTKKMMRFHTRKVHEGVRFFCDQFQESALVKWDGGGGGGLLFLHEF